MFSYHFYLCQKLEQLTLQAELEKEKQAVRNALREVELSEEKAQENNELRTQLKQLQVESLLSLYSLWVAKAGGEGAWQGCGDAMVGSSRFHPILLRDSTSLKDHAMQGANEGWHHSRQPPQKPLTLAIEYVLTLDTRGVGIFVRYIMTCFKKQRELLEKWSFE